LGHDVFLVWTLHRRISGRGARAMSVRTVLGAVTTAALLATLGVAGGSTASAATNATTAPAPPADVEPDVWKAPKEVNRSPEGRDPQAAWRVAGSGPGLRVASGGRSCLQRRTQRRRQG
jgi:hypothetical protein